MLDPFTISSWVQWLSVNVPRILYELVMNKSLAHCQKSVSWVPKKMMDCAFVLSSSSQPCRSAYKKVRGLELAELELLVGSRIRPVLAK